MDDDDSSDSDYRRRNWNDEDEREYRRQEELYAKRIFDTADTGPTQKLQSGVSNLQELNGKIFPSPYFDT